MLFHGPANFLPEEVLEKVLEYLNPEGIKNALLVCRRWKKILYQQKFWRWATLEIKKDNCCIKEVFESDIFSLVDCIEISELANDKLKAFISIMATSEVSRGKELALLGLTNIEVIRPDELGIVVTRLSKFTLFYHEAHLDSIFSSIAESTDLVLESILFYDILFSKDECNPELMGRAFCRLPEASFYNCALPTDFLEELLTAMANCSDLTLKELWLPFGALSDVSAQVISEALSRFRIIMYDEPYCPSIPSDEDSMENDEDLNDDTDDEFVLPEA